MLDRFKRALREALGTDEETVLLYTRARHAAEARLFRAPEPDELVNHKIVERITARWVIAKESGRFYRPVKREAV